MARTPKLVPPDDDYDDDVADEHGKHTKVDPTYTLLHGTALRHSRNFVHLTSVQLLHIVLVLPGAEAGEDNIIIYNNNNNNNNDNIIIIIVLVLPGAKTGEEVAVDAMIMMMIMMMMMM